ncbi:MAG: hypothetical protein AB2A00_32095 [Myxococcota bacterium]
MQACCTADETNCHGACVDTDEDPANCGACDSPIPQPNADVCQGGAPACAARNDGQACPAEQPVCTTDQALPCICVDDSSCGPDAPICCGGQCTDETEACGCVADVATGGAVSACSPQAAGGECISLTGTVLVGEPADNTVRAAYHSATCGCTPNNGQPVATQTVCESVGGFQDLCASPAPDAGVAGTCVPQNFPARDAGMPAGNCGEVGRTCDPVAGGLNCVAESGVGACQCSPTAANEDACGSPVPGPTRTHVVADYCRNNVPRICDCLDEPGNATCDPQGTTPDCCPGGCVNLETDVNNCGICREACLYTVGSAPCGTDGLEPGQCGCDDTLGSSCPVNGGGGGETCVSGACVCIGANLNICTPGTTCNNSGSRGCCEWGFNTLPNSCLPPVNGFTCPADPNNAAKRVCFNGAGVTSCCPNGCQPDGTCIP